MNADVSQISLRALGSQPQLRRSRDAFTRSALVSTSGWRFHVPVSGPNADADHWFGLLPLNDSFTAETPPYGQWENYMAGPRKRISWLDNVRLADFDPGALLPDTLHTPGSGRRLLTPLTGG
jgi:hypothetical protein